MGLKTTHILLSMDGAGLFQEIQRGIAEYREQVNHWRFTFCRPSQPLVYEGEEADGAIVAVASTAIEASWKNFKGPVVNVSHSLPTCRFPTICTDDVRAGELAILGVNNDQLRCKLAPWPLSSVELNGKEIGCRAARVLDHWMSGAAPDTSHNLIPPPGGRDPALHGHQWQPKPPHRPGHAVHPAQLAPFVHG